MSQNHVMLLKCLEKMENERAGPKAQPSLSPHRWIALCPFQNQLQICTRERKREKESRRRKRDEQMPQLLLLPVTRSLACLLRSSVFGLFY